MTKGGGAFPLSTMPGTRQWTRLRKPRVCVTWALRDEDCGHSYEYYEMPTARRDVECSDQQILVHDPVPDVSRIMEGGGSDPTLGSAALGRIAF